MEEKDRKERIVFLGLVVVVIFLFFFVFMAGGWVACSNGGGEMGGLTCYNLVSRGSCESLTGNVYILPDTYTYLNNSVGGYGG